jgi:tellurite resistance protein TerC
VKLVFHALHNNELPFINGGEYVTWVPEIGTWTSLGVIVVAMAIAVVASLWKLRKDVDTGALTLPREQ